MLINLSILKPGDVLLYNGTGFISFMIRTKTWSDVSHCETYLGNGMSAASRDGIGVNTYPFRFDGLLYVLRPTVPIDFDRGLDWHQHVRGQAYDTFGLLRSFFSQGRGNIGRQWCSEHTARMANRMGYYPFHDSYDNEKVSPSMFKISPVYDHVWVARKES